MPRSINEIITHILAVCDNPSVNATLIQTEDLRALCEAVDMRSGGTATGPVVPSTYALSCLEKKDGWKEQPFEYYAAHFLVGAGLIGGNLDSNIRGLTATLKKQYDIGVKHGARVTEVAPAG